MFAEAVGDLEAAGRWAIEGLERSREAGIPETIKTTAVRALPTLISAGEHAKALDASLEANLVTAVRNRIPETEIPFVEPIHDLAARIEGLPSEDCERASLQSIYEAALTSFLVLATDYVQGDADINVGASMLADACRILASLAPARNALIESANLIESVFLEDTPAHVLIAQGNAANREGASPVGAIAYFGASLSKDARLADSAIGQLVASHYVDTRRSAEIGTFSLGVLPFIEAFWRQAITNQAFRFKIPRISKPQFEHAFTLDESQRVQAILSAAVSGLRARLPEGSEKLASWLARQ